MGKNNKKRRQQKKVARKRTANRQKVTSKPEQSKPEFDPRISFTGISVNYSKDGQGISLAADTSYAVQDTMGGLTVVCTVAQSLIDKMRAVSSPYVLNRNFRDKHRKQDVEASWPHQWKYLSEAQRSTLQERQLIQPQYYLMGVISHHSFGTYIYTKTDIQRFLDTYTEIAWIDYAIRQQLKVYEEIYDPKYVTTGFSFEFNSHVARCWVTLEHSVIRISGMWDRLVEFLVPLYFLGKTLEELSTAPDNIQNRAGLAKHISMLSVLTPTQKEYWNLLIGAAKEFQDSTFKNLRNRVVHEYVPRPEGAVPTGSDTIPDISSIEDLHRQILEQLSAVREAVLIFTALMIHKEPINQVTQVTS